MNYNHLKLEYRVLIVRSKSCFNSIAVQQKYKKPFEEIVCMLQVWTMSCNFIE